MNRRGAAVADAGLPYNAATAVAKKHVFYVSPHADDVAFSAAAHLAAQVSAGARVTVLTLFGERGARSGLPGGGADERAAEDAGFAEAFGVRLARAPFVDARWRRRRYRNPARLFSPLGADEAPLVAEVAAWLRAQVADDRAHVVAPLGVGGHIDHQIAHEAAARLTGVAVQYYEDMPYALMPYQLPRRLARLRADAVGCDGDATLGRGSVGAELQATAAAWMATPLIGARVPFGLRRLAVATLLLPEWMHGPPRSVTATRTLVAERDEAPALAAIKLRAIACYPSQWPLFYATLSQWAAALERYGRAMGAEGTVERRWRALTKADR